MSCFEINNGVYLYSPKHFEQAIERFVYSCAGYCVATYVLVSDNNICKS